MEIRFFERGNPLNQEIWKPTGKETLEAILKLVIIQHEIGRDGMEYLDDLPHLKLRYEGIQETLDSGFRLFTVLSPGPFLHSTLGERSLVEAGIELNNVYEVGEIFTVPFTNWRE